MIADLHNDLPKDLSFRSLRLGEVNPFRTHYLPVLEAGGVGLQVCAASSAFEMAEEGTLRLSLEQVAAFNEAVRDNEDRVLRVMSRGDLEQVVNGERIGLLLMMEGAEPLGYSPALFDVFWDLGVRMVSLSWNRRNPFADGAAESGGGLSKLGEQLVDRLVAKGALIDVVHTSEQTFWEVLERSGNGPIVCGHAACRAILDHPRNLRDDQLRALAARNGVLGLILHPIAIDHDVHTLDRVVDHIDHAVDVMGVKHVALGSDFMRQLMAVLNRVPPADTLLPGAMTADAVIDGIPGPEGFPRLLEALERRGYDEAAVAAIASGNVLRVLRDALPA